MRPSNNPPTAAVWIRDGVLINRMHINAAAFAFATWKYSRSELREKTSLEELINFAFEKSGISCADKMRWYERERENIGIDVDVAVSYYNTIASEAANRAGYFPGALDLLRDLQNVGVHNFITSAVDQDVLDNWLKTEQGQQIDPLMDEVLGKREDFHKGREHFEYISAKVSGGQILYVADATSEIQTGSQFRDTFNIKPIGFANVIHAQDVLDAFDLIYRNENHGHSATTNNTSAVNAKKTAQTIHVVNPGEGRPFQLTLDALNLGNEAAVHTALKDAGASSVIGSRQNNIMQNLRAHFKKTGVL